MVDVYVSPLGNLGETYFYIVNVDGVNYDEFKSKGWLTASQMRDVAIGYAEALEHYDRDTRN